MIPSRAAVRAVAGPTPVSRSSGRASSDGRGIERNPALEGRRGSHRREPRGESSSVAEAIRITRRKPDVGECLARSCADASPEPALPSRNRNAHPAVVRIELSIPQAAVDAARHDDAFLLAFHVFPGKDPKLLPGSRDVVEIGVKPIVTTVQAITVTRVHRRWCKDSLGSRSVEEDIDIAPIERVEHASNGFVIVSDMRHLLSLLPLRRSTLRPPTTSSGAGRHREARFPRRRRHLPQFRGLEAHPAATRVRSSSSCPSRSSTSRIVSSGSAPGNRSLPLRTRPRPRPGSGPSCRRAPRRNRSGRMPSSALTKALGVQGEVPSGSCATRHARPACGQRDSTTATDFSDSSAPGLPP